MSSTVPRSILGLIDRPAVPIPTVVVPIPAVVVPIPAVVVLIPTVVVPIPAVAVSIPAVAVSIPAVMVPIPAVAVGSVSYFDASDFVGMFSRPKDIVGGVSPDSFRNPAGSPAGLRDCEVGRIGGGVSPCKSNIPDSSPNKSSGSSVDGIGGGVSLPLSRSAVHSSAASDTGGTTEGVSPLPSRRTEKSPTACIVNLMDSSFWDEIH